MLVLIKNEWIKLIKKKSSWIMWLIMVGLTFGYNFLVSKISEDVSANQSFAELTSMTSVLNLIVVVVVASCVAEEFSRGTIKFLLIRPYTRTQILFSKFITCFVYGVVGTVILYLASLLSANLFLAAESPFETVTGYFGWNAVTVAGSIAGANLILMLLYISITIFISAAIRSQNLAVGLGVAVLFGSPIINNILMPLIEKQEWLKWNIFNIMNIKSTIGEAATAMLEADYPFLSLNFWQMTAGIIVYSVAIYFLTNYLFNKRDASLG
jgi:ABC-2 type transport system permease protein